MKKGNEGSCASCGNLVAVGEAFCSECGQPLTSMLAKKVLQWDRNIPPRDILTGSLKVLGISVLIMWVVVEVMSQFTRHSFTVSLYKSMAKNDPTMYYAAGFVGFFLLLTFLICWAMFSHGYEASFRVGPEGAAMDTRPERRRVNSRINKLLFWVSLLSGRPGGMGTAMLAQSRQSTFAEWSDVKRIKLDPERWIIHLKNSWRTEVSLYCTPENYQSVLALVEEYKNKGGN